MSNEQILDQSFTAELRELDPTIVDELIDAFFEMMPTDIALLEGYLAQKNFEEIRKKAHSMKSSAGNLGGVKLSKLCFDLEKNIDESQFQTLIAKILPTFNELKAVLILEKTPK